MVDDLVASQAADRRNPPEHALFVTKPGPLREEVLEVLGHSLACVGLAVIARVRRRLSAGDVRARFKYAGPEYVELWTRGDCDALLVRGFDAPVHALRIKDALREEFGRRREELYNLLHLCDTGWEFVNQFELFFPERDIRCCAGFGDLLIPSSEPQLEAVLSQSSAGAIGLIDGTSGEIDAARSAGVATLWLLRRCIDGVAFLGVFVDPVSGARDCSSAESFFDWVHERRGLVFLDENDALLPAWSRPESAEEFEKVSAQMLDAYRRHIEPFRRHGLDGMVVVHPRRDAFRLEVLWQLVDAERLLQLGGSAGVMPPLTVGIDRTEVSEVFDALARV